MGACERSALRCKVLDVRREMNEICKLLMIPARICSVVEDYIGFVMSIATHRLVKTEHKYRFHHCQHHKIIIRNIYQYYCHYRRNYSSSARRGGKAVDQVRLKQKKTHTSDSSGPHSRPTFLKPVSGGRGNRRMFSAYQTMLNWVLCKLWSQ